jgi:hypothetical protein
MAVYNYNHGKFFGPTQSYTGYFLIVGGLIVISYSLISIALIIPGAFLAFTYTGTILDTDNHRVKPYTTLFGIIRTGKWIDLKRFTRINIIRSTRKYTTYSRGSVRFDMDISDIQLRLMNNDGTSKVILNKYIKMEEAQKEKEELSSILFPVNEMISQTDAITQ